MNFRSRPCSKNSRLFPGGKLWLNQAENIWSVQTMNLGDERPLWEILGLAVPAGTVWKDLRIGELKTLLALAIGDEEATREGC